MYSLSGKSEFLNLGAMIMSRSKSIPKELSIKGGRNSYVMNK